MRDAPVALAVASGLVALLNPCSFSLLPAYIARFMGDMSADTPVERRMLGALSTAAGMTAGFVTVFTAIGVVVGPVSQRLARALPWLTIAIGAALVGAGVMVLAGRSVAVRFAIPLIGAERTIRSSVLYGVTFAMSSLSCTIGPFLAVTSFALRQSAIGGLVTYAAYAAGMGIGVTALAVITVAVGRRVRPWGFLRSIARPSGGLLLVAGGLYAIWYGRWELAVFRGNLSTDPLVRAIEQARTSAVQFVVGFGAPRMAFALLAVTAAVAAVALLRENR